MIPKIFLDLDGVIVDFIGGAIEYYNLKCAYSEITSWDAIHNHTKMLNQEFWDGLDETFWYRLKKTWFADTILALVEPFKPCILTAPRPNGGATGKQMWIKENLPDYFDDERYLIGPGKRCVAGPETLLIDDYDRNVNEWRLAGGSAILVPQPWNSNSGEEVIEHVYKRLTQIIGGDW